MEPQTSPFSSAVFFALGALAAALVVIKLLTGLAFVPLAVIGVFVFVFALGLKLRLDRGADPRFHRPGPR
ncbi:MAG: hypothetical protein H0T72_06050 [Chloroflexia bacterium]|jgi:hypothetical protein|nr:hypothetical protein [Chloroflexia bacterium]